MNLAFALQKIILERVNVTTDSRSNIESPVNTASDQEEAYKFLSKYISYKANNNFHWKYVVIVDLTVSPARDPDVKQKKKSINIFLPNLSSLLGNVLNFM